MANTAEVINFPVPVVALQELRVADLDDGFTRIANELLEAVMRAGLSQHQLLVFIFAAQNFLLDIRRQRAELLANSCFPTIWSATTWV